MRDEPICPTSGPSTNPSLSVQRPAPIGLGSSESLGKGSLPFYVRTWKCAELHDLLLCCLFCEVLDCLTQEQTAGIAVDGMFKSFSRLRLWQQASGHTPPLVLRRAVWPQVSLWSRVQRSKPPMQILIRLY